MRRWLIGAALGALVMALLAWLVIANLPQWAAKVEVQGLLPPEGVAATTPAPSPSPLWSGPPVACGADSASLAGVTAVLAGRATSLFGVDGLQNAVLTVTRAGAPPAIVSPDSAPLPIFLQPIGSPTGAAPVPAGGDALCLARFAGDRLPTVLLGTTSGGEHCCTLLWAYPLTGSALGRPVSRDIGNAGVAVRADGDHALVVTADDAFADQFGPWASTGLPVTVVEFHNGAFTDATRQHLDLVTADAARWWAALTGGNVIQLGQLAPWVADQCLLGQGTHAWATVNGLQVLHRLDWTDPGGTWPTGAAYVSALHAFLTQHGYCA